MSRFHSIRALSFGVMACLGSVSSYADEVGALTTFVAKKPAKAADVNENFNVVKSAVNGNHAKIQTLDGKVTTQGTDIATLKAGNTAQDTALTTLGNTVSGHTGTINALAGTASTLNADVATLKSENGGQAASIETLNTTVADHTTSLNTLSTQGTDIATLKTENAAQATTITNLTTSVTAHGTDITGLKNENTAQGTSISTLNTTVNGHTASISSLSGDNTTNKTNIVASANAISALQARLDTLETQILSVLTFPHMLSASHKIAIAAGPGVVSYAGGDKVILGAKLITLPAFTMNTAANKTYHMRFEAGAWKMLDVASAAYNSSALPETDAIFDSRSDSMLAARVVTDSANTARADALINMDRLQFGLSSFVACEALPPKDGKTYNWATTQNIQTGQIQSHQRAFAYLVNSYLVMTEDVVLNWARTPLTFNYSNNQGHFNNVANNRNHAAQIDVTSRYRIIGRAEWVLDNPNSCLDISVVMGGSN